MKWAYNKGIVREGSWFVIDINTSMCTSHNSTPYQVISVYGEGKRRIVSYIKNREKFTIPYIHARPVSIKKY